jgi:hypothetical protein
MAIAILGDKVGDGLIGQEKGHRVEQRMMMLEGTCLKFVSDIVERTLAMSIADTVSGTSCVPYGLSKGGWVERDAECSVA